MSTHLLIAAAYLEDLPQGTKLILMAVADSADEHTLEAAPGLPKLRAWSGLGKSQALAIIAQLTAAGYLERLEAGRLGRRAVYRVFPAGVPEIPHPIEVAARFLTTVDEPVDNSDSEGPAHRTLGSDSTPSRVRPTGPLQSYTSVSRRDAALTRTAGPVDKPTPSASTASGFPGSRATALEDRDLARRARGAHDQPCPLHPSEIVPCGRCAHAAANADPAKVEAARQLARKNVRKAHTATPKEPTP